MWARGWLAGLGPGDGWIRLTECTHLGKDLARPVNIGIDGVGLFKSGTLKCSHCWNERITC
jgi:hypothetical protein